MSDGPDWDPSRYETFAEQRRQPFDDLVELCDPTPDGVVYDLGCGTGARTADLPDRLGASRVIGIDTSRTMLERAAEFDDPRLSFVEGDIAAFDPEVPPDLILSNAALHWLTDHPAVLAGWRRHLSRGGQLAVQVPVNFDHPTQQLITATAADHLDWFGPDGPPELVSTNSMRPEDYAEILHSLGAGAQYVALRVYPHVLDHLLDVVTWLEGTTLRPYRKALDDATYAAFIEDFSGRLEAHHAARPDLVPTDHSTPSGGGYLYTFKRVLFWARF